MHIYGRITFRQRSSAFCYVVLFWGVGTIIATALLGWSSWYKTKKAYPEPHQHLLHKKTIWQSLKHTKAIRTLQYCGPPHSFSLDQEGEVRPGDRLEVVIVIIRHGDRGPMQNFRNLSQMNCGVNITRHKDLQRFVDDMSSPGTHRSSRDPFRRMAVIPRDTFCHPGHLTWKGVFQQLRLGKRLHEKYIKKLKLLPENWLPEEVSVYSTMVERTYQSAISFLYGFLPQFDFAKLFFKVGLGATFCHSPQLCHCPLAENMMRRSEKDKWKYVAFHPAVKDLIRRLEAYFHYPWSVQSESSPDDVFDKLLAYVCHQIHLPCSEGRGCAKTDELSSLVAFLEWRGRQLAKSHVFRLGSRLSMQGFLTDLFHKMSDVTNGRKHHKFILYSAHDSTLMPLMVAIGILDGLRPPYASRMIWELYSSATSRSGNKRQFHLRILYNGKDITKRTTFCAKEMSRPSKLLRLCPFENFAAFVTDVLVELNATSFTQACNN